MTGFTASCPTFRLFPGSIILHTPFAISQIVEILSIPTRMVIKIYSSYLYQLALGTDPWDYSFRFCDELLQWGEKQGNVYYATVKTDVTLYFNAEFGTYTHRWVASETNED